MTHESFSNHQNDPLVNWTGSFWWIENDSCVKPEYFLKKNFFFKPFILEGFPHSSVGESSACDAGDLGLIPQLGRSPGEGNDNPLKYSCLENPRDGRDWWVTVHGVAKNQT